MRARLQGRADALRARTARTGNTGHGWIGTRRLTTSSLLAETCAWPGAQRVFTLERTAEIVARGQRRAEVAYGITSLTAAQADLACLLTLVREHSGQENGLHYRRDVTCREDAGHTLDGTMAQDIAMLNNLVLALLLRGGHTKVAERRRHYAATQTRP